MACSDTICDTSSYSLKAQQLQAARLDADTPEGEAANVSTRRRLAFTGSTHHVKKILSKSPMIAGYPQSSSCLRCNLKHVQPTDSAQNCLKAATVVDPDSADEWAGMEEASACN